MGVSVYYTCERDHIVTDNEAYEITAIINKYNDGFELNDIAESFFVYTYDLDQPTVIFEGSTKLPLTNNFEDSVYALFYWLDCLTDIRRTIFDGSWHVHLDGTEAAWDEEAGWYMPKG